MRTALAASVAAVAKWTFVAAPLGLQAAPEWWQAYIESFLNIYKLLMRTALAASVAAVAKWISGAAPLGLQAVLERRSVWSRAAGTRFARPVPQPESRHIDLPEQGQVYVESLLIMRTALAVRVAAVAKWAFVAAPLGLQAVPERQSVWSIAAGTRFARPVPQPESRRIDLPEQGQVYVESLLIMRTALAASVAAAAKWTFVAAPLGLQAAPERQSVWSRAAGTSFARPVPQPESRRIDLPERRQAYIESFLNIYKLLMRTALAASVAAVAKWISGAVSLRLQAVPERQSVWSIAAGTSFARPVPQPESRHIDSPEQGQVYVESLLIMRTALAASVAAAAKWTFVAAPLGLQAVPEWQSVWSRAAGTRFARPVPQPESRHIDLPEQEQRETVLCAP